MSVLLFYRRVVPFCALAKIRPKLCLYSRRHFGSALAKELGKQKLSVASSSNSCRSLVRLRQFSSKTAKEASTFIRMVKYVLIASGVLFWFQVLSLVLTRHFPVVRMRPAPLPPSEEDLNKVATFYQFDLSSFKEEGNVHGYNLKAILKEVEGKHLAVSSLWAKLKSEEAFLRKFGKNVTVTGRKKPEKKESLNSEVLTKQLSQSLTDNKGRSDDPINIRDTFEISLYIDGSEASGLVTMQLKKVPNNKSDKVSWIPVSLLIETRPDSGVQICHISAPPPNGLTRFSKLFVDQQ